MVPCQPSPSRSPEASWLCSPITSASGRSASAVRRTARATSWLTSTPPSRPVMLATSIRQPSTSYGGRSHRATTLSVPSTIAAA